jgi:hypothetical protein
MGSPWIVHLVLKGTGVCYNDLDELKDIMRSTARLHQPVSIVH